MTTHRAHDAPPDARRPLLAGIGWVAFCVLLGVLTAAAWIAHDQRRYAAAWLEETEALDERLRLAIDAYGFEQQRLLRLILNQPGVSEALAQIETLGDEAARTALVAALQPIWGALRESQPETRLYVHQARPPRVLLRMHDPERWGENVDAVRALPGLARDLGVAVAGFEAGVHGGAFRAALPVTSPRDPQRIVAVLEIGDPPATAFAFFRQRSRSQLTLFHTLATETRLRAFRPSGAGERLDTLTIEGVGTLVGVFDEERAIERATVLPSGSVLTETAAHQREGHDAPTSADVRRPTTASRPRDTQRALWIPLHDFVLGANALTTTDLEATAWVRATLDHLRVEAPPPASLRALPVGAVTVLVALLGLLALRGRAKTLALQAAREATARRLEAALEGADVGTWEWDIPSDMLIFDACADRWLAATPASQTRATPQPRTAWLDRLAEPDRSALAEGLDRLAREPASTLDVHVRVVTGDAALDVSAPDRTRKARPTTWLNLVGRVVERDPAGRPLRAFGIVVDTTLEQLTQIKLVREASTDPLTGLLNRAHFLAAAEQARTVHQRGGRGSLLVLFDLDHFKTINDRYGHDAGDDVLVAAARRVAEQLRPLDAVGRIGGEEFAMLLNGCQDVEHAGNIVERLRAAIAETPVITAQGQSISITASFGVARLADQPVREALRAADAALYAAKRGGRNRVVIAATPAAQPQGVAESGSAADGSTDDGNRLGPHVTARDPSAGDPVRTRSA